MPGIAGIISKHSASPDQEAVGRMTRSMMHEPFHVAGAYANDELRLCIGWVAQAGAFAEGAPIWNEERDICVLFSGDNYADPDDLWRLQKRGHTFEQGTPACVVHLYEEHGTQFLFRLNGWFSGVVVDLREKKSILFNDRFGVNRIYWYEDGDAFYFASEAKALLEIRPELRKIDFQSVGEFISCSGILQNRSLFSGVSSLPGGSAWIRARDGAITKTQFFRKEEWESQSALSSAEYYEKLKDTWARILPRYFAGKERVGLSLTGGVDSRMILAWAPRAPGDLPCYTFGGRYRDCADVTISREIARLAKQPHQTIPVSDEFLHQFPALAEKTVYISDGAMDVTGAIDLYVQRKAREIAPVRMSGVYGGEILRRLVMFKPGLPETSCFSPELAAAVAQTAGTYAAELQGHRLSFTAFKQAAWYMTAKFAIERSQLSFRTPYFDNELVALAYQVPAELVSSNEISLQLIADGQEALRKVGTDRGLVLKKIPGLTKAAHLLQEFTFKAEYAYDYGMPQWLAAIDHVFAPFHLERLFLGRHKFHHFRVYYRDHWASYVRQVLLDARSRNRPYLNGSTLERLVNDHLAGRRNHTVLLHKLLSLELVQRQFIERA